MIWMAKNQPSKDWMTTNQQSTTSLHLTCKVIYSIIVFHVFENGVEILIIVKPKDEHESICVSLT